MAASLDVRLSGLELTAFLVLSTSTVMPLPLLSFPPPPILSHISYPLFSSIQPKPKEDEAAKRKKTDEPSPDDPQPKEKEKEKEAEGGEEGEEEEKEKQPSPQPEESFIAEDEEVIIPV